MELAVRRSLGAVHLGLVTAAVLLAASTVSLLAESAIASVMRPKECARSGQGTPGPAAPVLEVAQLSRVTGTPLAPGADPTLGNVPGLRSVRTALRVRLLGTLLSSRTAWSIATVLDLTRLRTSTLMVGDRVQDARVLEILRDRVVIDRRGHREFIGVESGDGVQTLTVRSLDEDHYEMARSEVERVLGDLGELWTQVRVVPTFKDGQPQGFRLFAVRPDSLFSKLGLLSGDVIKRINGFEMNSAANALEVYARLRDANRIDVELERESSSIHKTYSVR